ncbi:MAG: pectin acetylesterase-family hydrolase [Polyangiales bacterium]
MRSRFNLWSGLIALGLSLAVLVPVGAEGKSNKSKNPNKGLTSEAAEDLRDAGVDKYLGQFSPATSEDVGDGWTKHTFDPDGGEGPICIAGTPYTAFTRAGNPAKVLIFLNGGGACWEGVPSCSPFANEDPPAATGIFADSFDAGGKKPIRNKFSDWSIVYLSYCDGSVFVGDNVVVDPDYLGGVRHHRGLRNASAGIDLARATFPNASRILLAGSSAGGAGVAAFAPFLVRFTYGNLVKLSVFNDAGPVAISLAPTDAIAARAADWDFGQFYPASCDDCDPLGEPTAIIDWRLENDRTIREAFYSTDADSVDRSFLSVNLPGFFDIPPDFLPPIIPFPDGLTQVQYRDLILTQHGLLNEAYPDRYKRFIRSGSDAHTALRSDLFYLGEVDGVPLNEWTDDFVIPRPFWIDLVEDFIPVP